ERVDAHAPRPRRRAEVEDEPVRPAPDVEHARVPVYRPKLFEPSPHVRRASAHGRDVIILVPRHARGLRALISELPFERAASAPLFRVETHADSFARAGPRLS